MSNPTLSTELSVLVNQLIIARNEINNLRQQLTALRHTHRKDVENIKQMLDTFSNGSTSPNTTVSSEQSTSTSNRASSSTSLFPHQMIGTIETGLSSKRAVPRQSCILAQSQGILRIDNKLFNNPQHALEGLEQFSHMWILFYFHKIESNRVPSKVAPPRLNGAKMGVFATRSPNRPTPIGLSLVKIDKVKENCVFFSGVDMLDGTPVLDIKPYIPTYDTPYPSQLTSPTAQTAHEHRWERLPRDADSRSEDGDLDLQERLLIGESHSSEDSQEVHLGNSQTEELFEDIRLLDGRDSDSVFVPTQCQRPLDDFPMSIDRSSQREAPEGSEGGSPLPTPHPPVRVPAWINHPPLHVLTVHFDDNCLEKILQLVGTREGADRLQSSITSVLREDPRTAYVRERYSEDPYICNILGYRVGCLFDDTSHACLVTNVELLHSDGENSQISLCATGLSNKDII